MYIIKSKMITIIKLLCCRPGKEVLFHAGSGGFRAGQRCCKVAVLAVWRFCYV